MKHKYILGAMAAASLMNTACSDFLDTVPHDALTPETTWKTEADAEKFLIGCYSGWIDDGVALYADCGSDIGYNQFQHEGWYYIGNGGMYAGAPTHEVHDFFQFNTIRNCNDFLENIKDVPFADETKKTQMIGQVKTIRAWQYFEKNWYYGGVPIIESYATAEEAQVPRNTEAEVKEFFYKELDEAIPMLKGLSLTEGGRINEAVALAIKMRSALYYGDFERARDAAAEIMKMGYELEPSTPGTASGYEKLFLREGKNSKEIIFSVQHDQTVIPNWTIATMYNNGSGGYSSMVPTQNLIDMYEMNTGLTKDENGSNYDATHPFANRDPRMALTVLYPGMDWETLDGKPTIINTLDKEIDGKKNIDYPTAEGNSSKTGLSWAKYLGGSPNYYADPWSADANTIMFRYAEVLLTWAEAENELNGPSNEVYNVLNKIRGRVNMPVVNRTKYATRETLRELIRRERTVELAGEGFRRADILRWKDAQGKMLAETVLDGDLKCITGTLDYEESNPELRAKIDQKDKWMLVEKRVFKPYNRYLPIPQTYRDKNPKLSQNDGY